MAAFALKYARAFQQVTTEQHLDRDAMRQQLADIGGTFAASHDLREFLSNPSLGQPDKLKMLDAVAQRVGLDKAVRNFIAVLMDHQRLDALHEIIAEYETLADAVSGIAEAEITSAKPLAEAERNLLQGKAGELAGSDVRISWLEDPALIGGAIIRLGSSVYDGSVRGQLLQMKQHLAGTQ